MSEIGGSDIERLWNWNSRWTKNRLKMASFEFWVVVCRIRRFPTLISKFKWLGSRLALSIIKLKFLKYNQVSTIMWERSREFEPSPSSGLSVDILLLAVKRFESKFDLFRIKFKMITSRSIADVTVINILNLKWLVSYANITVFKLLIKIELMNDMYRSKNHLELNQHSKFFAIQNVASRTFNEHPSLLMGCFSVSPINLYILSTECYSNTVTENFISS